MNYSIDLRHVVRAVLGSEGDGDNAKWCRNCFVPATEHCININQSVELEHHFCPNKVVLRQLLSSVNMSIDSDPLRSSVLCFNCYNAAISTFVFRQFCLHSEKLYNRIRKSLTDIDLSPELIKKQKSLYIVIDHNSEIAVNMKKNANSQCAKCGKIYTQRMLKKHVCSTKIRNVCSLCQRVFPSKFKYQVHVDRHHREKVIECQNCPKKFASEFLLVEHCRAMHKEGECRICKKKYNTSKGLREHEQSHVIQWTCTCGKMYKYREGLRLHEKTCKIISSKIEPYPCPHCQKKYMFKHSLRSHIEYVHSDTPIQCDTCNKKFITKSALRNHISTHTGVKNYKCGICHGTFTTRSTLLYHLRALHTHEKPFPCGQCSESFITSCRRTEHQRKKHGAPAPTCSMCNARFVNVTALRKHMKKHNTNKIVTDALVMQVMQ